MNLIKTPVFPQIWNRSSMPRITACQLLSCQVSVSLIDAIVYITYQPVLSNLWQKSIDHLPKSYSGARTAGTDPCYDFILVDG